MSRNNRILHCNDKTIVYKCSKIGHIKVIRQLILIAIHIRVFELLETYLMRLPENGTRYGPKHTAVIT